MDRTHTQPGQVLPRLHLAIHVVLGAGVLLACLVSWQSGDQLRFASFIGTAALASVLKVRLPGAAGDVSLSALFVLFGLVNLSLPETLLLGVSSMLLQSVWRREGRPRFAQVLFNICVLVMTIYLASIAYSNMRGKLKEPVALGLLAITYFVASTFPAASRIAMKEGRRVRKVWRGYGWMLPYYAVGASLAWLISTFPPGLQWEVPIAILPLVCLVHRSNQRYIVRMEREQKHVVEMNALHLRTIEALALAIDAKDHNTHDHLRRVQLYAMEIGKDLGLSKPELDALRAASMLHDIGKLAVPESIISKPGKLTRDEFDKMKIHPVVGAEILEMVEFPYPVAPVVESHHEKWDGSGYPYGLKGDEIPIGARILAAVDCLDALASDRQYRRAMPLVEAMSHVVAQAGTSFDPQVVQALQARYCELEARVQRQSLRPPARLSKDLKITRGGGPATGFEADPPAEMHPVARVLGAVPDKLDFPAPVGVEEALAVIAFRMKSLVSYDAIGIYRSTDGLVSPLFVTGDDHVLLDSLRVPNGEGVIGWVAEVGKPILNANPSVEPDWTPSVLSSVTALPLLQGRRTIGVLALYRRAADAFTPAELEVLLQLSSTLAPVLLDRPSPVTTLSAAVAR